jgi:hypothetical protein
VSATDDGSETFVIVGGDLTVDLSAWPSSEWAGVQFKTSNPSILSLVQPPSTGGAPVALFVANQVGTFRRGRRVSGWPLHLPGEGQRHCQWLVRGRTPCDFDVASSS